MRKFLSQINRRVHRLARKFNTKYNRKFNTKYKLNHMNRGVINFIDVGLVGGLPEPRDGNANLVKFCLNFEPNDAPTRSPKSLTYNTAVWEKDETRDFYNRGLDGTGSSLFKQHFKYVRENYEKLRKRGPVHLAETWFERSELVNNQAQMPHD